MNNEAIELLKEEISFTKGCPNTCDRIDAHAHKKGGLKKLLALLQAKPKCETGNEEAIKFWLDAAFKARTMVYTNYCVNKACSLLHKPTCDDWIPVSEKPKENGRYLVCIEDYCKEVNPTKSWREANWVKVRGWLEINMSSMPWKVTHWKPIVLPKPTCETCNGGIICSHDRKANSQFAQNCIDNNYKHYKSCKPKELKLVVCNRRKVCIKECGAKEPHRPEDCEPCPLKKLARCVPKEPDAGELVMVKEIRELLGSGNEENWKHIEDYTFAIEVKLKQAADRFVQLEAEAKDTLKEYNDLAHELLKLGNENKQQAKQIAELPLQVVQDYIKVNQGKVVEGIMTKMVFADKYGINSGIFERLAYALTSPLEEQIAELVKEWKQRGDRITKLLREIAELKAELEAG